MEEASKDSQSVLVTGLSVHVDAARFFVELAKQLDVESNRSVQVSGKTVLGIDPLMSISLAAVLNSYCAIEAFLNEMYLCETEDFYMIFIGMQKPFATKLDSAREAGVERMSVRAKTQLALTLGGAEALPWDDGIGRHVVLLGRLRNELVHHKARWVDDSLAGPRSADDIERSLFGRFPLARAPAYVNGPFRWSQCLGAGCAEWAWASARLFINEVSRRLKLGIAPLNF